MLLERYGASSRVTYCLYRPGFPVPYAKLGRTLHEVAVYLKTQRMEVLPLPEEEGWPEHCEDLSDEEWATVRQLMAK
jgi:hypothetical protein